MNPSLPLDPMVPLPCRIVERREEGTDLFTVRLEPPAGAPQSFQPGQFNMLYLMGLGEVAISLCGDPSESKGWIHTIRAVGKVTQGLQRLRVGDVVGVRGPFGTPWPEVDDRRDVVVVAGGLGLAPVRPALYRRAARKPSGGKTALLVGARTPEGLLYNDALPRWCGKSGIAYHEIVNLAPPQWPGPVGNVTQLFAKLPWLGANTNALLCGPEVMMVFAGRALRELGVPADRIFVSLERNMKCAVGFCGHCQYGPDFLCRQGPVLSWERVGARLGVREL